MGEFEKTIFKQSRRQRMELPAEVRDAPVLNPGLEAYMEAFGFLSTCRQLGMGEGPIPWTAMHQYVTDMGVDDPDERVDFYHIIKQADEAYLAARHEKSKVGKKDAGSEIIRPPHARTRSKG